MGKTLTISLSKKTEEKLANLRQKAGLATDREAVYYAIDNCLPQTTEELVFRYSVKQQENTKNMITFRRLSDGVTKTLETPARSLEEARVLHLPLLELCAIIEFNGVKVES